MLFLFFKKIFVNPATNFKNETQNPWRDENDDEYTQFNKKMHY